MIAIIMSKHGLKKVNLNRRKAIHERCLNCVAWESHKVIDCEILDCSLYPYRTGEGKQSPKERSVAIKQYCKDCTNGKLRYCGSDTCPLFKYRKTGMRLIIKRYLKKYEYANTKTAFKHASN